MTAFDNIAARKRKEALDSEKSRIDRQGDGTARLATGSVLGAIRSLTGTAQGASGLFDLLSPGKGTNRFSKSLDSTAKDIDSVGEGLPGYKGSQLVSDIAQLVGTGGLAAATKVGGKAAIKLAERTARAAEKGTGSKLAAKATENILTPANSVAEAGYNLSQVGQDESKDKGINAGDLALNIAAAGAAGTLLGGAGTAISGARNKVSKGVKDAVEKQAGAVEKQAGDLPDAQTERELAQPLTNKIRGTMQTEIDKEVAKATKQKILDTDARAVGMENAITSIRNKIQAINNKLIKADNKVPKAETTPAKADYKTAQRQSRVSDRNVSDFEKSKFTDPNTGEQFVDPSTYNDAASKLAKNMNKEIKSLSKKPAATRDRLTQDVYKKYEGLHNDLLDAIDKTELKVSQLKQSDELAFKPTKLDEYARNKKASAENITAQEAVPSTSIVDDLEASGGIGAPVAPTSSRQAMKGFGGEGVPDGISNADFTSLSPQEGAVNALNGGKSPQELAQSFDEYSKNPTAYKEANPDVSTNPSVIKSSTAPEIETHAYQVPKKIVTDDKKTMVDFIDHARGVSKLSPVDSYNLELAASRIAEHYGMSMPNSIKKLANVFDKRLQTEGMQDVEYHAFAVPKVDNLPQQFTELTDETMSKGIPAGESTIEATAKDVQQKLTKADAEFADILKGEAKVPLTKKDKAYLWLGEHFMDSHTFTSLTLGEAGSRTMKNLINGSNYASRVAEDLSPTMGDINKITKKLSGGSEGAKRQIWERVSGALEDRANPTKYLQPGEEELFAKWSQFFDYFETQLKQAGVKTVDDYTPWRAMRDLSEAPEYLADALTTGKRADPMSDFVKKRGTAKPDDITTDGIGLMYSYFNAQKNFLAYNAAIEQASADLAKLPPSIRANGAAVNKGVKYLQDIVRGAVKPEKVGASGTVLNNVYRNLLRFNFKLATQNTTQRYASNSYVSKAALKLNKKIPRGLKDEFRKNNLSFGDKTITGELVNTLPEPSNKLHSLNERLDRLDFYAKSESRNITTSFDKGVVEAVVTSEPYKSAVRGGASEVDAFALALKDPQVVLLAKDSGNVLVNNTQFGANSLAKPKVLRNNGQTLLGVPLKTFTMFMRFPIGMSQHILENANPKYARAIDVMRKGNPVASSIAENRMAYGNILRMQKDTLKGMKAGTLKSDQSIEAVQAGIKEIQKQIDIFDSALKEYSPVRGPKSARNLSKMWGAAAAIQFVYDGGINGDATVGGSLLSADPTAVSRLMGQSSPLLGTKSSLSPIDKNKYSDNFELSYGAANLVPLAGTVINRQREADKWMSALNGQ